MFPPEYQRPSPSVRLQHHPGDETWLFRMVMSLGWHYLSNATCLIRPRMFYMCFFVVSRITIICHMIRHF